MHGKIRILTSALLVLSQPVYAQISSTGSVAKTTESVTVTAQGVSKEQIDKFVQQYAVANARTDKLARWEDTICPVTLGLSSSQNEAVSARILDVAAMVGAGSAPKGKCHPRIIVIFTAEPQDFMNVIKHDYPKLLGRHYYAQTERASRMTYSAQAWYDTATRDISGYIASDTDHHGEPAAGQTFTSTGLKGFDGLSSQFRSILIVIDLNAVAGHQLSALSDFVAMLALSQTQASDICQPLPTITNLLSKSCDPSNKTSSITEIDAAYLRALYSTSPSAAFLSRKNQMFEQIEQALATQH